MRGKIRIGENDVEMLANAASPVLFKKVFRVDWFKTMSDTQTDESGIEGIGHFEEMGFIMAMQAVKTTAQLMGLCYDDYLQWLEQFESEDLMIAVTDIANIYRGQEVTYAEPKKEDG